MTKVNCRAVLETEADCLYSRTDILASPERDKLLASATRVIARDVKQALHGLAPIFGKDQSPRAVPENHRGGLQPGWASDAMRDEDELISRAAHCLPDRHARPTHPLVSDLSTGPATAPGFSLPSPRKFAATTAAALAWSP